MPEANGVVDSKTIETEINKLSVQHRAAIEKENSTLNSVFWFVSCTSEELIAPWWSPKRDRDLRLFWMRLNNDILQGAISSMCKKFTAMNWVIEGPQRVVKRYQELLANAEFGQGWGVLISKTIQDYLTQDKGAFWELIGEGDPTGEIVGPVLGIAHLDSQFCQLTGDLEFPVIFHSARGNEPHRLHTSRVVHLVDMPSPNELMNNIGFSATSRVIGSSQVLLKIVDYKNEKMDDLPQAGLLVLNNILPGQWQDAKADYARDRRRIGQELWANIMAFHSVDPAQPASADFTSFSGLPDAFNELETINIYVNILALAFGVDTREFWPITGGALGSATEAEVMHQKARGKGVGEIISVLERAINWKVLPSSATFAFDFKNDDEDKLAADIDKIRTDTIMSMWKPSDPLTRISTPVSALEIRQMLSDNVSYFSEEFLTIDITPEVEGTDTDQVDKMIRQGYGPVTQIDYYGRMTRKFKQQSRAPIMETALTMAEENWRKGEIAYEDIAEFALAQLSDGRHRGDSDS